MKKLIIILTLLAVCSLVKSQIPNYSFETWVDMGGWFQNPEYWYTNNAQVAGWETKLTGYDCEGGIGLEQLNLVSARPIASVGFPLTGHPYGLTACVGTILADSDTVSIKIVLFDSEVPIDSGEWKGTTDIATYTDTTLSISQTFPTADSAVITITGGNHIFIIDSGSTFRVDYLRLEWWPIGNNKIDNGGQQIKLFPNPTNGDTYISFGNRQAEVESILIRNSLGKIIQEIASESFTTTNGKTLLDLKGLSRGYYFVELIFKHQMAHKPLIKF